MNTSIYILGVIAITLIVVAFAYSKQLTVTLPANGITAIGTYNVIILAPADSCIQLLWDGNPLTITTINSSNRNVTIRDNATAMCTTTIVRWTQQLDIQTTGRHTLKVVNLNDSLQSVTDNFTIS